MSAPSGPERATSRVVGENVRAARNAARNRDDGKMTVRDLAARMTDLGHPIAASGISAIENGKRSITVDQLTALAAILDRSPVELLTPKGEPNDRVTLSGTGDKSRAEMVAWLRGEAAGTGDPNSLDLKALGLGPETTLRVIANRLRGRQRGR